METTVERPMPGTRLRGFSAGFVLVGGVVLIPMLLGILFNSYSTPDADAFVRMAFAQVAGATIAIVTVIALLAQRIVRRSSASTIAWFSFIALAIVAWQVWNLAGAAELLLTRLTTLS